MIIGISGRIGSGKDTVGSIAQVITEFPHFNNDAVFNWGFREIPKPNFEIKKYADKLKDMVCLLIGCSREQLESHEFKNLELGEEWDIYIHDNGKKLSKGEYEQVLEDDKVYYSMHSMTPRLLLQLLGTECGRNILHPEIWTNSLFSDYVNQNWIITDMRFPNELKSIKDRQGVSIRVKRGDESQSQHESEVALDSAEFDYVIENTGTIMELIEKVRAVLVDVNIVSHA